MKVREIKQLRIELTHEENNRLKIVEEDLVINKKLTIKNIQRFNIEKIIDSEVVQYDDDNYYIYCDVIIK